MLIKLDDQYLVRIDRWNHTLIEKIPGHFSKHGPRKYIQAYNKELGYYPNMRQLLNSLIQKRMSEATDRGIEFRGFLSMYEQLIEKYQSFVDLHGEPAL